MASLQEAIGKSGKPCGPKRGGLELFHHWSTRTSTSCPPAYCVSSADILCAQRSRPCSPPNEMMIPSTCLVAAVTIVRSESLVGLPCGPAASQNIGNPSRFKSYLPMPLYVSLARPTRRTISPVTCSRSYSPIGRRLSTDTRLITSTTALICGNPFPATTRRSSASAEPRYRAGSFPNALYALRAVSTCIDSSTPRGKGNFWISFSRIFISWSSAAGDAPATTCAVTQASAVRGHFAFNFASIVTFIISSQPASASPKSAAGILLARLFRIPGSVPVCAKRPGLLPRHTRCGSGYRRAAESPAAPGPSSRALRTSAFQFPPSEFRLPGTVRSPATPLEIVPPEHAAERPAHQYKSHVPPAAVRWAPLRSRCDFQETPWTRSGISNIPLRAPRSIRRQSLPGRAPPVRHKSESLRSKSAGLFPVAPAGRRWCTEIRRCWPCHLSLRTWCSRRHAKTSPAQSRAEIYSRSSVRAI